nr:MAG TPA: hypothetical protein [Caudoviricetes sp.]
MDSLRGKLQSWNMLAIKSLEHQTCQLVVI